MQAAGVNVASCPSKGVTLSAFPRIVSVSAAAIGLVVAIGIAPPASATPCEAAEANIEPPASAAPVPAPAPVVRPPTGRRPTNTNDRAPLPKLGPLISSLLRPGTTRYSAPLQQQAQVVPRAEEHHPGPIHPNRVPRNLRMPLSCARTQPPNRRRSPPRNRRRRPSPQRLLPNRSRGLRLRWSIG